jgi:hypothetical protein
MIRSVPIRPHPVTHGRLLKYARGRQWRSGRRFCDRLASLEGRRERTFTAQSAGEKRGATQFTIAGCAESDLHRRGELRRGRFGPENDGVAKVEAIHLIRIAPG